jgi:phage N-6-adenine-methyltransferase
MTSKLDPLWSSKSDDWSTPQWLFDKLDSIYKFTLDPAASHENHKCDQYYTKEDDGLTKSWKDERVFVNPPYGRNDSYKWVQKAYNEYCGSMYSTIIMLLPARTDTRWFHQYCAIHPAEIIFIRGRLKFGDSKNSAPFPSMICIFDETVQRTNLIYDLINIK